jgi:hypothetical protein
MSSHVGIAVLCAGLALSTILVAAAPCHLPQTTLTNSVGGEGCGDPAEDLRVECPSFCAGHWTECYWTAPTLPWLGFKNGLIYDHNPCAGIDVMCPLFVSTRCISCGDPGFAE